MFEKISCKITDSFEQSKTISNSERELYQYGLRQIFITILNIVTTLLIGFLMGMIAQAIIFTAAYIPIRIYAGGFHASTPVRCWAISAIMLTLVLFILKLTSNNFFPQLSAVSLIACIVIILLSPVEDMNKPLDDKEHRVYHFRTIAFISTSIAVTAFLYFLSFKSAAASIEMVWISLSVMLIVGKIKNHFLSKKL